MNKIGISLFLVSLLLVGMVVAQSEITIDYPDGQEPTKGIFGQIKDFFQPFSLVSDGYSCSSSASVWKQFTMEYNSNVPVGVACSDNAKVQLYQCNNGGDINGCISGYEYLGEKEKVNGVLPRWIVPGGKTFNYACFNCQGGTSSSSSSSSSSTLSGSTSSDYCSSSLWSGTGVSALCTEKGGENFKIKSITVKDELGGVAGSLNENSVYTIHVKIKNEGSTGSEYVEVGYYDQSGHWLEPLSIASTSANNCRMNEVGVQNKLVTLSSGQEGTLTYTIKTPKIISNKQIRVGVVAFHRCWTQKVQNDGGDGTTATVYITKTLNNMVGIGGTPTAEELCNNAMKDEGETGIDCGGDSCPSCDAGYRCVENNDCSNNDICLVEDKICSPKLNAGFEVGKPNVCQDNDVYRTWLSDIGQRSLKLVTDCQSSGKVCEDGACVTGTAVQTGEVGTEEVIDPVDISGSEQTAEELPTTEEGGAGTTPEELPKTEILLDENGNPIVVEETVKPFTEQILSIEEGDYGYYTYAGLGIIIVLATVYFALPKEKKRKVKRRKRK